MKKGIKLEPVSPGSLPVFSVPQAPHATDTCRMDESPCLGTTTQDGPGKAATQPPLSRKPDIAYLRPLEPVST